MDHITQHQLADYEKVDPPLVEKSNFYYSFSFLPKEERNAISSVYAFCSYIDDIVDGTPNTNPKLITKKMKRLDWWERELDKIYNDDLKSSMLAPFSALVNRFHIPKQYFNTLIDGVRRDLTNYRYQSFADLKDYLYSVASVVGLISIEIFGYKYEETKNYAVNLGYALQLTNILRDIKIDKDRGYIYLPQDELQKFNLSDVDIINENYDDNFVDFMMFQTSRAREFYHLARKSLRPDEKSTIMAAEIMDAIYYRLLEKIELNDYNVYEKKIRVSTLHKILVTFKHWLSIKMFINRFQKSS